MPSKKCEHGISKYYCNPCGGKGMCEHKKRKTDCKLCGGSSICIHEIIKYNCRLCSGQRYCEHGKKKLHVKFVAVPIYVNLLGVKLVNIIPNMKVIVCRVL